MVPQFIDVEDKIFGPVTVRQFVIILGGGAIEFVLYKLFTFWAFAIMGFVVLVFVVVVAFLRVNGMPFHFFLLNLAQTFRRPRLRLWAKEHTVGELRAYARTEPEPPPPAPPAKEPLTSSKLQELALVVNTGGVYKPEKPEA